MKSATRSLATVSLAPALLAAAIAVCLVSFALPVRAAGLSADQLSNVQALLQSYGVTDAKIQAVSAVLSNDGGVPQIGSSTPCAVPARPLVEGMRSSDVETLQSRLVADGYLTADNATGYFGSSTEAALKQWQADQGIVASGTPETTGWGSVGQKTIQALGTCNMRRPGGMPGTATSSPAQPMHSNFQNGNGTPVPQAAPQGQDNAAGAVGQFISDYSTSFNDNLAAVATAPYNVYVPMLSSFFYSIGIR